MPSKPMFWTMCMIGNKFLFQHFWVWGLLFRNNEASLMAQWWIIHLSMQEGEGNDNPLQCSCLQNPGDSGAWWAAVYGVAQGQTWLKQFSSTSSNAGDAGDAGSIPGLGKSPGEGNGNPLQCSYLENPRDRGAWWAAVYGVAQVGHDWSDLAAAAAGARLKGCDLGRLSTDHTAYSRAVSPFLGYLSYVFLCLLQFPIERTIFLSFFLDYINNPCAS